MMNLFSLITEERLEHTRYWMQATPVFRVIGDGTIIEYDYKGNPKPRFGSPSDISTFWVEQGSEEESFPIAQIVDGTEGWFTDQFEAMEFSAQTYKNRQKLLRQWRGQSGE